MRPCFGEDRGGLRSAFLQKDRGPYKLKKPQLGRGFFCFYGNFFVTGGGVPQPKLPCFLRLLLHAEVGGVAVLCRELGAVIEEAQQPVEEVDGGLQGKGSALGHFFYPKGSMSRIDHGRRIYPSMGINMAYQMPMRRFDLT